MAKRQAKPKKKPRYYKGEFTVRKTTGYCALPVGGDTYHGTCPHKCLYCTPGEAPVLMANGVWRPISEVQVGDAVIGFDRDPVNGAHFKYAVSQVEDVFVRASEVVTIGLSGGKEVRSTRDHHWFTDRKPQETQYLYAPPRIERPLIQFADVVMPVVPTVDYKLGYIQGVIDGDGSVVDAEYPHKNGSMNKARHIRLAMKDVPVLDRYDQYCTDLGFPPTRGEANCGNGYMLPCSWICGPKALAALAYSRGNDSDDYWRGWLAGIFDAEGSFTGTLRICQYREVHPRVYAQIVMGLSHFGYERAEEEHAVRVKGGRDEIFRFWQEMQPVLWRKFEAALIGTKVARNKRNVKRISKVGNYEQVFALKTSTGNYISQGYLSRNCYERQSNNQHLRNPTLLPRDHRGLFNSLYDDQYIMYYMKKHRVAIRIGILSEPFPYLEARAKATLRTVKLLARAGLQVQLTTKNPGGVTDEHVAALKKCPKAMVRVSFSTLDDDLAAKLEPGAKPPSERLAAMRRLSDAGIEVGCRFSPFLHTVDHDYSRIAETGATNVTVELFRFSMLWRHSFPPEFWEIVSGQKFPGGSVKDKESFARQWVTAREKEFFAPLQDPDDPEYHAPVNLWIYTDVFKLRDLWTKQRDEAHKNGLQFGICGLGCGIHNIDLNDNPCGCLTPGWQHDDGALVPRWHVDQWASYIIPDVAAARYDLYLERVIFANAEWMRPIALDPDHKLDRKAILEEPETDLGESERGTMK